MKLEISTLNEESKAQVFAIEDFCTRIDELSKIAEDSDSQIIVKRVLVLLDGLIAKLSLNDASVNLAPLHKSLEELTEVFMGPPHHLA